MLMSVITLIGLCALAIGLAPGVVDAKFITIEASVSATVENGTVKALVSVANRGDEPAHHVVVRAEIGGTLQTGTSREILAPNDQYAETLTAAVEYTKPGRYPVIITVDYTDGNQYPFSAISIVHLNYKENIVGRVVGEMGTASIESRGSVKLKIKNLGQTTERLQVRLVTPKELAASPERREIRINPNKEEFLTFKVRNASALFGSRYQIYGVLTYEQDNYHFSHVIGGQVAVEEQPFTLSAYTTPLLAVVVVVGGLLIVANLRKRPRA